MNSLPPILLRLASHPLIPRVIVVFALSFLLCTPHPYVVLYKGELSFPLLKTCYTTQYGGTYATLADFQDPNLKKHIKQHGWILYAPIPYAADTIDYDHPWLAPPSLRHWLGTDSHGQDVLTLAITGVRTVTLFCLAYSLISFYFGSMLGTLVGFYGARVDYLMQSFFILFKSIPLIFVLIAVKTVYELDSKTLFFLISAFGWGKFYYLTRTETLKLCAPKNLLATQALGLSHWTVLSRYIFPHNTHAARAYLPWHFIHGISAISTAEILGIVHFESPTISHLVLEARQHPEALWISASLLLALGTTVTVILTYSQHNPCNKNHTTKYAKSHT